MGGILWSSSTSCVGQPASERPSLLIRDLYAAIERDYEINQKKSSRNIKGSWKKHLEAVFGNQRAREFDPELVQNYIVRRQREGAKSATINREIALLKRASSLALETIKTNDEKLISSLVRWSKLKCLKERNVRKGFVKDAEYEALASETGRIGLWLRAMFECAYAFGFRKTELLTMKVSQFDTAARSLSLEAGETKNDDARLIDLSEQPKLFELLRECACGKAPNAFLFTREKTSAGRRTLNGGRIVDFRDSWDLACERAGCPGLLFHDLRRTGVSNMIRDGLDEKVAMTISGHKTRSVFDRYHIVRPEALRDAARKMAKGARERQRAAIIQADFFEHTNPERKVS